MVTHLLRNNCHQSSCQQPTPTHHHCGTRGGKQEWNLHTKGCSSPSKPSAGGRASGRQSRRVRNRRTGRHTRNYWTITENLCATSPPKCSTLYHSLPLPQPRAMSCSITAQPGGTESYVYPLDNGS